ncbi:hypothetical protein Tco_0122577 [Tanacetum coccineum]
MTSSSADESQNYPEKTQTQNVQQIVTTTVSNNNAKFPYLKKDEYETWAMKMEYWIMNKQIVVQRETKARTLLLQSLPEDHMANFHHLDDARDIWLAVKARFRGNEESKKIRKSMLKQEALPSSWSQVAVTLKAKGGLDYLNFDDLYNKLKSLEINIKGGLSYKSNHSATPSHSAFVSTTSADNKMSYAETPKQSSLYTSASHFNSGNIMEDVLHSFVAESDPQQHIIYEDFDQIGKLDLEELDIKWKMAMLSARINRFEKKAGRKMKFNNRNAARFDKKKVGCYKCLHLDHFARECTGKQVESNVRYSAFKLKELEQDKSAESKALLSVDLMVNWSDHEESADENASQVYGMITGCDDEDEVVGEFALTGATSQELQTKLDNALARFDKWKESSKNLAKLVDSSMSVKTKLGLGYGDYIGEDEVYYPTMPSIFDSTPEEVDGNPNPVRFVKEGGMNVVHPPITGKFMPTSIHSDFDESQMTYEKKSNDLPKIDSNEFVSCASSDKTSEPKTNDFALCDSSDKSSSPKSVESSVFSTRVAESESNNTPSVSSFKNDKHSSFGCNKNGLRHYVKNKVSGSKSCFVCGSFSHLIKDCDFYENKMGVYSLQRESRPMWNNVDNIPLFVPQASNGRSGKIAFPAGCVNVPAPIPTGRQTGPAPVYAGIPVPAGRQNRPAPIHAGRPFPADRRNSVSVSASWRKNVARSMYRPTSSYFQNSSRPVDFDQMYMGEGRWEIAVKSSAGLSQKWIESPNVSNVVILSDCGTVTFGGGDGRITRKGTIKTSKLDFENVYYVEELQNFNLFSVSQICDKKNKVLFIDTECLVLSKDFKLPDDN